MSKLVDFYGDFARGIQSCTTCGWTGPGNDMESGEVLAAGIEKYCPGCGARWGYVQFSMVVADDHPDAWRG
jgi:hypothetical protein